METFQSRHIHPGVVMKKSSLLLAFLCLLLNLNAASGSFLGKCLTVLDGDTIDVARNGTTVRIRLEGIDCQEIGQPFAEKAKVFTQRLAAGKTVSVIEKEKDSYGRTVARVYVDGRDLSVELLKAGLARHYKSHNSDWLLAALEDQAKADRVGIWAASTATPSPGKTVPDPAGGTDGTRGAAGLPSRVIYHGNVSSRIFHSPSCADYSCKNCTRVFRSREEAITAGFKPCGTCKP